MSKPVILMDVAELGSFVETKDALEGNAFVSRSGVQRYTGEEVGRSDLEFVDVYRDESEVFKTDSLNTFSKIPITIGHPDNMVSSNNWRDLAVGVTGEEVLRDGGYLKIGLKITDASAIKVIKDGIRELSVGYISELVWGDGITDDGQTYQARQINIQANHVAIVKRGKAGYKSRIGDDKSLPLLDDKKGNSEMPDNLQTVVLGDAAVQVALGDVQAIERFKDAQTKLLADAKVEHDKAIAAKDVELAARDTEIKKLKDAALDDVALDKLVTSRATLVSDAKKIDKDVKVLGVSDTDIRKSIVVAKLTDAVIAGKSDAYIEARFDGLVEAVGKNLSNDGIARALQHQTPQGGSAVSTADAYSLMLKDMRAAHEPRKETV